MRRVTLPALALLALAATSLRAQGPPPPPAPSLLGADGAVYRVLRGAYRDLLPNPPANLAANPVLVLEVAKNGVTTRSLVPGSDGPTAEAAVGLAADASRVYLLWGDGKQIDVAGWTDQGWDPGYAVDVDPSSTKVNPQLVATTDTFPVALPDGSTTTVTRTILHLMWTDSGSAGTRILYTAIVSQQGQLQRSNRVLDLQQLAGASTGVDGGGSVPANLLQHPQLRPGRDGKSVVVGIASASGALATLELRPVGGDVTSFADSARAVTIETGLQNPGASRSDVIAKARAVTIETGRNLFKSGIADLVAQSFWDGFSTATATDLDDAAETAAWAAIDQGAGLLTLPAKADSDTELQEVASPEDGAAGRQVLDVRHASLRTLPAVPDGDVRLFLSPDGDDAAVAWAGTNFVRYRESNGSGWGAVQTLWLTPTLGREDAFALVQQRMESQ